VPEIPHELPRLRPRKPQIIHDELPPHPPLIQTFELDTEEVTEEDNACSESEQSDDAHPSGKLNAPFRTECDSYGVYREYPHGKPTITPDQHYTLSDVSDSPYLSLDPSASASTSILGLASQKLQQTVKALKPFFAPFRNPTVYRLMDWFNNSSISKSLHDLNQLVKNVLLAPDFKPEELIGFSAIKENEMMDTYQESESRTNQVSDSVSPSPFEFDDTWIKGFVDIPLPCDGVQQSEDDAPKFRVEVYYRNLMEVIKSALSEFAAEQFHIFPFKAFWKPGPDEPPERIYSELYTGDFWNQEYDKLRNEHDNGPNRALEAFIVSLMIWSDATCLAQFGSASLWPIYLYFGNQSKYFRGKPTSFAAHHVAYLPKVFQQVFVSMYQYFDSKYHFSLVIVFRNSIRRSLERRRQQRCSRICVENLYKQSGCYFWMTSSCMPIFMGLYFSWSTGLCECFILDSSHTLQTIRKSKWLCSNL
jgi:hypothetical protein